MFCTFINEGYDFFCSPATRGKGVKKEEERRKIADVIIERKVVDYLKTKVSIKDKSVTYEKFSELAAAVK